MAIKISTIKRIRLCVPERVREKRRGGGREGRGEEEGEGERQRTKLQSTFSFTRHSNYFDYIREKASVLC